MHTCINFCNKTTKSLKSCGRLADFSFKEWFHFQLCFECIFKASRLHSLYFSVGVHKPSILSCISIQYQETLPITNNRH